MTSTPASGRPAAGGPASGVPARGYSWPPFAANHKVNRTHGARDPDVIGPLAAVLAAGLREVAPWCAAPAFAHAVMAWSWAEAQAAVLREWIDAHPLGENGEPPGAVHWAERVENRAMRLRAELGLSPQALGLLLTRAASVAAATGDEAALEALRAEGQRILASRAALAAEPEEERSDGG